MYLRAVNRRLSPITTSFVLVLQIATALIPPLTYAKGPKTSGSFALASSMNSARAGQIAAILDDGRLLIAGGFTKANTVTDSAEIYDPVKMSFATADNMTTARAQYVSVKLLDGRVLVIGGGSGAVGNSSAEIYDPGLGSFISTGSMTVPRFDFSATLLKDGTVLVAGGFNPSGGVKVFASAEIYDPATGLFSSSGKMNTPRAQHTATLLNDGHVLLAGGTTGSGYISSAELYDSVMNTFASTGGCAGRERCIRRLSSRTAGYSSHAGSATLVRSISLPRAKSMIRRAGHSARLAK
jgi:hypothetical protein